MMKILHDENLEYTNDPVAPRNNNEVRASGTIFTFVFSRAEDHQVIPHFHGQDTKQSPYRVNFR